MRVDKKRRREHKTDYLKRVNLLKSGLPRAVFRRTNKYFISQYILSKEAQDKAVLEVNSKELIKYGWPKEFQGSLKSIPAAYLTGFLIGRKILKQKLKNPIADLGMLRILYKTKVYGFLKGLKDSGIEIKCGEEMFPEDEKIQGKNLKKDFSKTFKEIKLKIDKE